MKKLMVSLAAAPLLLSVVASADVDVKVGGQAVLYYETHGDNGKDSKDMFDQSTSNANVGLQLNLGADLTNGFTFGSQISYLGTAGLEKQLVSNVKQDLALSTEASTTNQLALTQINVAKTVGNSTVKLGRMELPKSLSPFAYSEGWNVFKNTFDAVLAINSDIPDTTIVGAYVSGGTGMDISTRGNLTPKLQVDSAVATAYPAIGNVEVDGTAYMLTVANKSIPMTAITLSYYSVANVNADSDTTVGLRDIKTGGASAIWGDVKVASKDLPLGLKVGLQGGTLTSEESDLIADTTAFGAKVSLAPVDALTVCLAYTGVDGDDSKSNIAVKNFGTGIKSPLYTQMIYNQDAIALDGNTIMGKVAYNTGDFGTVIAQYAATTAGKSNLMGKENDYGEFDVMYKLKAGGVQYFAAYINRSWSEKKANNMDSDNKIRVWARLNF